jgi:hypothetical protein
VNSTYGGPTRGAEVDLSRDHPGVVAIRLRGRTRSTCVASVAAASALRSSQSRTRLEAERAQWKLVTQAVYAEFAPPFPMSVIRPRNIARPGESLGFPPHRFASGRALPRGRGRRSRLNSSEGGPPAFDIAATRGARRKRQRDAVAGFSLVRVLGLELFDQLVHAEAETLDPSLEVSHLVIYRRAPSRESEAVAQGLSMARQSRSLSRSWHRSMARASSNLETAIAGRGAGSSHHSTVGLYRPTDQREMSVA